MSTDNEKWYLCFYNDHEPTFETFDSKEQALEFVDEQMTDNPGMTRSNFILFPPHTSLYGNNILTYGVPKRFWF